MKNSESSKILEILKFVRAGIDSKSNNLKHHFFKINHGTISAKSERLAVQAPFPLDLNCCPHAEQLIKAISACEGLISFHLENGKLVVRSGKFKSNVALIDPADIDAPTIAGQRMLLPSPIIPTLRKLLPFVEIDENRPWANGIMISNNSAFATNSIVIVEHWLPIPFPVIVNIPRAAVVEIVRLKIEPVEIQVAADAVTFHLPGNAWFSCKVMSYQWPDVQRIFATAGEFKGAFMGKDALESILADVEKIEPFCAEMKAVYFHKGAILTALDGGTSIENPLTPSAGAYRADQLTSLRGMIDRIGFDAYPAPVPFFGEKMLRGVMVGYRS